MNAKPIVRRAPDGTLTLEWHGPDTCHATTFWTLIDAEIMGEAQP